MGTVGELMLHIKLSLPKMICGKWSWLFPGDAASLRHLVCNKWLAMVIALMVLFAMDAEAQARKPEIGSNFGDCRPEYTFGWSEPEAEGVRIEGLLELTRWVKQNRMPILSLLISRNGKIVYELYTSSIRQDEAHYLMS